MDEERGRDREREEEERVFHEAQQTGQPDEQEMEWVWGEYKHLEGMTDEQLEEMGQEPGYRDHLFRQLEQWGWQEGKPAGGGGGSGMLIGVAALAALAFLAM